MKKIAIYGAGGFGREIACLINLINMDSMEPQWDFIGFFDDNPELKGTKNEYGYVLGGMDELNSYPSELSIAISIGDPHVLKTVVSRITNSKIDFPNLIAPSTLYLDKEKLKIGKGNIISSRCTLSCNVTIGDFNILNGYITIGHDVMIESYNVVMPSVSISGGTQIGECNFLGVQSVILQYLIIGNNVKLGANSVLMHKPKDGYLYIGNPAKKIQL